MGAPHSKDSFPKEFKAFKELETGVMEWWSAWAPVNQLLSPEVQVWRNSLLSPALSSRGGEGEHKNGEGDTITLANELTFTKNDN